MSQFRDHNSQESDLIYIAHKIDSALKTGAFGGKLITVLSLSRSEIPRTYQVKAHTANA